MRDLGILEIGGTKKSVYGEVMGTLEYILLQLLITCLLCQTVSCQSRDGSLPHTVPPSPPATLHTNLHVFSEFWGHNGF